MSFSSATASTHRSHAIAMAFFIQKPSAFRMKLRCSCASIQKSTHRLKLPEMERFTQCSMAPLTSSISRNASSALILHVLKAVPSERFRMNLAAFRILGCSSAYSFHRPHASESSRLTKNMMAFRMFRFCSRRSATFPRQVSKAPAIALLTHRARPFWSFSSRSFFSSSHSIHRTKAPAIALLSQNERPFVMAAFWARRSSTLSLQVRKDLPSVTFLKLRAALSRRPISFLISSTRDRHVFHACVRAMFTQNCIARFTRWTSSTFSLNASTPAASSRIIQRFVTRPAISMSRRFSSNWNLKASNAAASAWFVHRFMAVLSLACSSTDSSTFSCQVMKAEDRAFLIQCTSPRFTLSLCSCRSISQYLQPAKAAEAWAIIQKRAALATLSRKT